MRMLIVAALVAAFAGPVAAADFTDPAKLVAAIYDQYKTGVEYPDDDFIRSQQSGRLNALYDADAREAGDDIGRIDFDPYVNGQDYDISKLVIHPPYLAGGKAVVNVTFSNMDTPQDLGILLVKEGMAWKVDDIWTTAEDYSYDLLDLLQAPLDTGGAADSGATDAPAN